MAMFDLLAPGGMVIVASGDADALPARLAGVHWWYWFLPEHVSFVSPAWFDGLCRREHLQVTGLQHYAHGALHGAARVRALLLALAYAALGRGYLALLGRLYRRLGRGWPPCPHGRGVSRDHLAVGLMRG